MQYYKINAPLNLLLLYTHCKKARFSLLQYFDNSLVRRTLDIPNLLPNAWQWTCHYLSCEKNILQLHVPTSLSVWNLVSIDLWFDKIIQYFLQAKEMFYTYHATDLFGQKDSKDSWKCSSKKLSLEFRGFLKLQNRKQSLLTTHLTANMCEYTFLYIIWEEIRGC